LTDDNIDAYEAGANNAGHTADTCHDPSASVIFESHLRGDLVRFAGDGDGTERDVFLSMHWNNIGFNEVNTDAKNGVKSGRWGGVVDIKMGVGEGGVFVGGGTGSYSLPQKSNASFTSK